MVVSRMSLRKVSTNNMQQANGTTQEPNEEGLANALPTLDDTLKKLERVDKAVDRDTFDGFALVDHAGTEDDAGGEQEQSQEKRPDQVQELDTPTGVLTESHTADDSTVREEVHKTPAKRQHSDIEEVDSDDNNAPVQSSVQEAQSNEQMPKTIQESDCIDTKDATSPHPASHQPDTSSSQHEHNTTPPFNPSPKPHFSPHETTTPVTTPKTKPTSTAPPTYTPIKKRRQSPKKKNPRSTPAKKQPKPQLPAPEDDQDDAPPSYSPNVQSKLWCSCRQPDDGELMIACDAPGCRVEWYHAKCVGVVVPPANEWICPGCRGGKRGKRRRVGM